jgi:hypothetical protein
MRVRDPIHGDIELNPVETAVLAAPEVQRLRGIKQLGTASLVYPGCTHSRFEHSLGACHNAHRIVAHLRRGGTAIDDDLETAIGTAALLHDVTHVPYGHTLEDERCLFPRHDKGARWAALLAGSLGERLDNLGIGAAVGPLLAGADRGTPPWAAEIVSSTIDADLLDYLRRDSYYAGVAQAYDDRIFHAFVIAGDHLAINMSKHGMERPDVRSETLQVLRMRYFLTERIYLHHTKVAAGAMISKGVELAQHHGALDENALLGMTDATLFQRLLAVPSIERPDPAIARLVRRLETRALLKRGYVISALSVPDAARATLVERFHAHLANRREAETYLANALGCEEGEAIIHCPALTVMKEAKARVCTPAGVQLLNAPDRYHSAEIQALEARYAELWRLYVFVPAAHTGRTADVCQDIFGFPSEFQRRP